MNLMVREDLPVRAALVREGRQIRRFRKCLTGCFANRTAQKTGSANYFFTGTA
jgi:hypothetical protein